MPLTVRLSHLAMAQSLVPNRPCNTVTFVLYRDRNTAGASNLRPSVSLLALQPSIVLRSIGRGGRSFPSSCTLLGAATSSWLPNQFSILNDLFGAHGLISFHSPNTCRCGSRRSDSSLWDIAHFPLRLIDFALVVCVVSLNGEREDYKRNVARLSGLIDHFLYLAINLRLVVNLINEQAHWIIVREML